jgi:flagellar basal-body rod modification protein FlgD
VKEQFMAVNGINGEQDAAVVVPQGTRSTNIDKDAFLTLLVVQLQNQDPTAPQSNTEFIAQLATFSSLEQLTKINEAVTAMAKFFDTGTDTDTDADTETKSDETSA